MKFRSLTFMIICLCSFAIQAQDDALSVNAAFLFDGANTTLNSSDKNLIAELSGFEFNTTENQLYRTTYEQEANLSFDMRVYPLDLTFDGIEEIAIVYGPKSGSGKKGLASLLFTKDSDGVFKLTIDEPGEFYFINLNSMVFPDVLVMNEQFEMPIFRWDGNQYNAHKLITRNKLKKLNMTSVSQASRSYIVTLVRE